MKLLIATRNAGKLREIAELFTPAGVTVVSAFDFPEIPDVVEDGATLEANAIKKAVTLSLATGLWALADDTGLEVQALDGAPGVYSARYAGPAATYADNNAKLLRALTEATDRAARFRCVVALSSPSGRAQYVEGVCGGRIAETECGTNGFGYDPLFIPDGDTRTFAELSADEKNEISHRGRALEKARGQWNALLAAHPDDWPA